MSAADQFQKPGEVAGVYPSSSRAAFTVAILVFTILIAYIDRQVLSLLVAPLKEAFSLSDTRVSLLQGLAVNVCFGLATLPLGLVVDRGNRVRLIAVAAVAWSVFTGLSGLCTNFWELFGCRMGVGIAEAGLVPAAYSLIADLYPARNRSTATLVFMGGAIFAGGGGIALSGVTIGLISHHSAGLPWGLGSFPVWRLTFLSAALPGLLIAALFLAVREPERKEQEDARGAMGRRISLVQFLQTNGVAVACLCCGLVAAAVGTEAILMWMPTILQREFGMAPSRSGEYLGLALGAGSLSGITMAGVLTHVWGSRGRLLLPIQVLKAGALVATVPLAMLLFVHKPNQMLVVTFLYLMLAYGATAVGPALMLGIAPNHLRGRTYAIWTLMTVATAAVWPTIIGSLSDRVFHGSHGLLLALCAVVIPTSLAAPLILTKVVNRGETLPPGRLDRCGTLADHSVTQSTGYLPP
jgi:MFS family permease